MSDEIPLRVACNNQHTSGRAFKDAAYTYLAQIGKAFCHPIRLEILVLLAQAPYSVEEIAHEVNQPIANVSHHLQALKRAQLVKSQRNGLHIIYTVSSIELIPLLTQLHSLAQKHSKDLQILQKTYFSQTAEHNNSFVETLDQTTLLERLQNGAAILVDVRPTREFQQQHLPNAVSLPMQILLESKDLPQNAVLTETLLPDFLAQLPTDKLIIAYCRGPFCTFAATAVQHLRYLGYHAYRSDFSIGDVHLF